MYDDVRAVFDGANPVGSAERVVDDQREAARVGELGNGVDVGDVGIGVAQCFNEDGFRIGLYGRRDFLQIVDVDEGRPDSVERERMPEQVVGTAVNRFLGDDMLPGAGEGLYGVRNRRRAGGRRQRRCAAFQRRDSLLQDALRRIREPSVDVAGVRQPEPRRRVFGVVEHVGRGLINRYRAGVGSGVGRLLSGVEL